MGLRTSTMKMGAAFAMGVVLAGTGAYAVSSLSANQLGACVNKTTRVMTLAPKSGVCPKTSRLVAWNKAGPAGPKGDTGPAGAVGSIVNSATGTTGLSVEAIAAKLLPAVVSVSVNTANVTTTGSGSIIRSDASMSYILTNNHVIADAVTGGKMTVEFEDGSTIPGTVVGYDTAYDLAVVKVLKGNLPVVTFGDSSNISIGDSVLAVGSPLGLSGTVTSGIISALNRPVTTTGGTGSEAYIDALQTDAAVNPGNSGGPLVDSMAQVIGVNSAIATLGGTSQTGSIGLGFAIPINQAKRVSDEIIATGASTRPLLGVSFDAAYTGDGAKIVALTPGGGAVNAGIPLDSVVRRIDGIVVHDTIAAIVRIRSHAPGDTVRVNVDLPNGTNQTFSVVLGSAPSN
ncbi:MAG TPA: trypsin-like peptidase domain-containing protein [Candidatus Nanopelagicaceae bacterium]|nr:trypsin-like peptidase domain-containing protein [Candidatus Nanopelagicaceae bacterium]